MRIFFLPTKLFWKCRLPFVAMFFQSLVNWRHMRTCFLAKHRVRNDFTLRLILFHKITPSSIYIIFLTYFWVWSSLSKHSGIISLIIYPNTHPVICCFRTYSPLGAGNGLMPVRHQAITWTSFEFLSAGPSETHFNEILIEIQEQSGCVAITQQANKVAFLLN